jgi:serine/threonine protein kinase/Leucine-rich repeat (LRR) protein
MLTTADFVETLKRLHLLSAAQCAELTQRLRTGAAEPRALAGQLLHQGLLTAYQVNRLLQGRAQELVVGPYVILERLGEGGMGAVYKARHQRLERLAAVKVIRPERLNSTEAVRRFQREVRAAAQLEHPNVVRAFDADEVAGTHFLVLEYVDGIDLARLVNKNGPVPVAKACEYIRQAALGLQHAFERGLVHRDIKPANLLLTSDGATVKVLDMGLARLQQTGGDGTESGVMTHDGAVMGTPDFIAPEQARSAHEADIRADLYSLGCTLYFLLIGEVPFPGGSLMQKLFHHHEDPPPSLCDRRGDVPAAVEAIVHRLMAKRPEERYQSPIELAEALALARDGVSDEGTDAPVREHSGIGDLMQGTLSPASTDSGSAEPFMPLIDLPAGSVERPGSAVKQFTPRRLALAAGGALVLLLLVLVVLRARRPAEHVTPVADAKAPATRPTSSSPALVAGAPVDETWLAAVAALPAQEQVRAVAQKLRDCNPQFDGELGHKIEGDIVTELSFSTRAVDDITPLRALTRLRRLACRGAKDVGVLADLSPLADLRLTALDCGGNLVASLVPLKMMPLCELLCDHTRVADLAPLTGLPLARLDCSHTNVATLIPLQAMPLRELAIQGCKVADLTPLEGMRLTALACDQTAVTDLSPLRRMPLAEMACNLAGVADLAVIESLPLRRLRCPFDPWRDAETLRAMRGLEEINGQASTAFWQQVAQEQTRFTAWVNATAKLPPEKQVAAVADELRRRNRDFDGEVVPRLEQGVVTGLTFIGDHVTDLAPLRALTSLTLLACGGSAPGKCKLSDLEPLRGLPLKMLDCRNSAVVDLSPLSGGSLTSLDCHATPVRDLAPLRGLPLTWLDCSSCRIGGLTPLQGLPLTELYCSGNGALADLAPLAGLPLQRLAVTGSAVADLAPLRGLPLTVLECDKTKVSNLAPLIGMALEKLQADLNIWRDVEMLRSCPRLSVLNGKPAQQFWTAQEQFETWCKVVRGLPPADQVVRVAQRLKEANAGFDGKVESTIENGVVVGVSLSADTVADLSPVRALPGLRRLTCRGMDMTKAKLADLWPLRSLPLTQLTLDSTRVTDLRPLAKTNLSALTLRGFLVDDLSALHDLPLVELRLVDTKVADLTSLAGMPVQVFECRKTPLRDLQALKEWPLEELVCDFKPRRDTALLRSLKSVARINSRPATEFLAALDAEEKSFAAWSESVRGLKAEAQVKAVAAELKRRNPGFDGSVKPTLVQGKVDGLMFSSSAISDLSPVRALPALKRLDCKPASGGGLTDLWALEGLPLTHLNVDGNPLTDLSPLHDVPLLELRCNSTRIGDLKPLAGLRLTLLSCMSTPITDLEPLRGMPLASLAIDSTRIADLAPLARLPLRELQCRDTAVKDLTPLRGLKLTGLLVTGCPVEDLSPLKGMPLARLACDRTRIADLTPLAGMPLTYLLMERCRVHDLSPLHGTPLKELRCGHSPVEDLTPLAKCPLTNLSCYYTYVTDLKPVAGLPVTTLIASRVRNADLTPVRGLKLTNFSCDFTPVEDLTPLKGLPLTNLHCEGTRVSNLALLSALPLKELYCDFRPDRDVAWLRALPSLEKLNAQPAAQVLKDAGTPVAR